MASKFLCIQSAPLSPVTLRSCLATRQNSFAGSAGSKFAHSSLLESSFLSNEDKRSALFSTQNSSKCSKKLRPCLTIRSQLNYPIISPQDHWGTWTALFATGAFGIWSERTKIGSALSGALVSTLVGLAASNLGILPCEAPAYKVVLETLLPMAVPLLLFRADLRRIIQSTGRLLLVFVLGSGTATRKYRVITADIDKYN